MNGDKNQLKPKESKFDGYVLSICDDTPYHEGVEYWFRNNLEDVVEIAHDEWDWMSRKETGIYGFKYGQRELEFIDILPLDEEGEWQKIDKKKYPAIETDDNYMNVYTCKGIHIIFYKESGKCKICGGELILVDGKIYS